MSSLGGAQGPCFWWKDCLPAEGVLQNLLISAVFLHDVPPTTSELVSVVLRSVRNVKGLLTKHISD